MPRAFDELRVYGKEFADTVDLPKTCSGVDIDDGAARDEILRQLRARGIEDTEATGPPARTLINICSRVEQRIDDFAAL